MKYFNILIALLIAAPLSAQTEKGATPLAQSSIVNPKSSVTRAVVIGISDYQDEQIPDLRFADRDAEAFAQWLRSPAGGSLPDNQIKVLTNKDATTGKMIAALDGLIVASKPGDEAIIYFSGHGDVERVTKFQRGFLLTYDSPPAVYAAGAFSLQYLQDIVTTLSEAGVQAVVITDACRAGKLAGSEFGGSKATTAALAQQFANEVKILSCQPDEFSLEGEQWGGGRGCFSYHLVDALYGMADANADGTVNLLELGRYLEDKVTTGAAPQSQIPFTVGSKATRLATVDSEALAQWRQQKNGEAMAFKKIDSRGLEDLALAKADTGVLEMYHAFTAALEAGNLMATDSTTGKSADDYYKLLIQEPSIAELHGLMTRNFAAALMDEGQQILNRYLTGDLKAKEILEVGIGISYRIEADKFYRAAELLGEKHYYYRKLISNALYFDAYSVNLLGVTRDSAQILVIKWIRQALALDPNTPHLLLDLACMLPIDSIDFYIERLNEISPKWPIWHCLVARCYRVNGYYDQAIHYYQNAIRLDSTYVRSLTGIAITFDSIGQQENAAKYYEQTVRMAQIKIDKNASSLAWEEWYSLLYSLWHLDRDIEAEQIINKYVGLDSKSDFTWYNVAVMYSNMQRNKEALQALKNYVLIKHIHSPNIYYDFACLQSLKNQTDSAYGFLEIAFDNGYKDYDWMQNDPDLAPLRERTEQWKALMKKYFPDQSKD
ncbi:MAG: caspase family protein [Saprospiraceae bacterium]|nr:caspase family protein [Saprospiraceae bacterium]